MLLAHDLNAHLASHSELLAEMAPLSDGTRVFPLKLPIFHRDRVLGGAWLRLPPGFPLTQAAEIWLDEAVVLRIPHVEKGGKLCIEGEPGPMSGGAPHERIDSLLAAFQQNFCVPWNQGELDSHFHEEALNYWAIHCAQQRSDKDPISRIFVLEGRQAEPRLGDGVFLPDKRVVLFGEDSTQMARTLEVLGKKCRRVKVIVVELPIAMPLTPDTWARTTYELEKIVRRRLSKPDAQHFLRARASGNQPIHRLLILRAPECSFGFLLPGGPVTPVRRGHSWRVKHLHQPIPLPVERLDVSWICGRDQHPKVLTRQQQRVLVIGAGALGSFVIESLVKAGVGSLTLVDPDRLSAANLGRHVLGAEDIGQAKVKGLGRRLTASWPTVEITPFPHSLASWLTQRTLEGYDLVLDLTGEPDARNRLELARQDYPCPLVIGWMEPFVAAAHACVLPAGKRWTNASRDPLDTWKAINWPADILQREPACSSSFQSYTHSAAIHAVALVTEAALAMLDSEVRQPVIRSMVRGRRFLDAAMPSLEYLPWAAKADLFDAVTWEEPWHA